MGAKRFLLALMLLAAVSLRVLGQAPEEAAIRAQLAAQVSAWNRGDIPGFMDTYENSAQTTFIGKTVAKGFAPILERYKKNYSTREEMGTLTFSDLEVRTLPVASGATEYAVVVGKFHLERASRGAGTKDDGVFSLVWHKQGGKWRIMLDHTS